MSVVFTDECTASGLVLSVPHETAQAWADGLLQDRQLFFPERPLAQPACDCMFLATLQSIRDWPALLSQMSRLWNSGSYWLITRTGNPIVAHHLEKHGAEARFVDWVDGKPAKKRYLVEPAAVDRFFRRLTRQPGPRPPWATDQVLHGLDLSPAV